MMRFLIIFAVGSILSGCAVLHHAQIGEIDATRKAERFEVVVSETGVNLDEAAGILKSATRSKQAQKDISQVQNIIGMFQMGPRTGNMVFDDSYADAITSAVVSQCPGGKITGLVSIRETNKYPVVSGEIVKITGYCIKSQKAEQESQNRKDPSHA